MISSATKSYVCIENSETNMMVLALQLSLLSIRTGRGKIVSKVILLLMHLHSSPLAYSLTRFISKLADQIKFDWFDLSLRAPYMIVLYDPPYKWSANHSGWREHSTSVRSKCTIHVCPGASKKSLEMVDQPDQLRRERKSNQNRWFGHCARSMCAAAHCVPWCVKKVLTK